MIAELPSPSAPSASSAVKPALPAAPTAVAAPIYTIPEADLEEFGRLPERVRADALQWLRTLAEVAAAPRVQPACRALAARLQQPGFSWQRIKLQFYRHAAAGGDWRALVNHSRAPELARRHRALAPSRPAEFKTFVHDFLIANQRGKAAQRYRALLERLAAWRADVAAGRVRSPHAIPGYDAPPPNDPHREHPPGWSCNNLLKLRPTRHAQTAFNIGRRAAQQFTPPVFTSRAGARVGQFFSFDDQVHDVKVRFPGNRARVLRPLEFSAMDGFSAAFVANMFKPTLWDADEQKTRGLHQRDFVWFALHWALNIGWRADTGTTLIGEHGTAKFPDFIREGFHRLSGGKIHFLEGAVDRRAAFPGLFCGEARGNFKIKAGLESSFNLVRNELADQLQTPGHVGRNRDASPEELGARESQNKLITQASALLTPDEQALLRYPFVTYDQFTRLAYQIYDRINRRSGPGLEWWSHDLEGWEAAGLIANEWRLHAADVWRDKRDLLALPPDAAAATAAVLHADAAQLTRERRLSPMEVYAPARRELTRAPGHWIALLLPAADYAVERTVNDQHLFEFEDQEISPSPLRYLARLDGRYLRPGEKFLTFVNPFAPDALYVSDARGRYLGECEQWRTECKTDTDALAVMRRRASDVEKDLLVPVARAGAALTRAREADALHNAQVLANAANRAQETVDAAAADTARAAARRAAALLAAAEQSE